MYLAKNMLLFLLFFFFFVVKTKLQTRDNGYYDVLLSLA